MVFVVLGHGAANELGEAESVSGGDLLELFPLAFFDTDRDLLEVLSLVLLRGSVLRLIIHLFTTSPLYYTTNIYY